MSNEMLAAWLLTVALHTTVLLGLAWLVDRGALRARPAWREMLWRAAFFGGVITASVQVMLDTPAPVRIALTTPAKSDAAPASSAVVASANPPLHSEATPSTNAASTDTAEKSIAPVIASTSVPARTQPTAAVASPPVSLPPWPVLLVAGWLAGALLGISRLAGAWIRLEHSFSRSEPVNNAALATDIEALAIQARVESPRLATLDDLASPIAARGPRILLPNWAIELLDREQMRAMLAHEIAHVARRDPAWKLAVAVWCAVFWFVPFAPLARRRLDEIAEVSCDAWTAIHLGDGRSLAECLAECAERRIGGMDMELAPAMAGRESPLLQRIDYLVGGIPMNIESAGRGAGLMAASALLIAAFALPGVSLHSAAAQTPPAPPAPPAAPAAPAAPSAPAQSSGHHVHVSADLSIGGHDVTVVQVSDDKHGYKVNINGKATFNDTEDDVATLSDGGTASFSETRAGRTQRVEIASHGGKLERRYFVNDKEQPLDAEASKWMAELIPAVIRETALDAEGRVARLRAKGGADLVLDEIGKIESGYARGQYLRFFAAGGKITPAQMTRALGLVDGIDGDYEKRNALAALGAMQPLDAAQQKMVLAQAEKVQGDYERAELLLALLPQLAPEQDVRAAWLKAASGIHSDYELRRTLSAMLDRGVVDEATLSAVVESARMIDSDYERRELLTSAIKRTHNAEALANAYGSAAAKIGSDYERREALLALIRAPGFAKTGSRAVLDAAAGIHSDYDCREVLVALARVMPNDAELIARYRDVARHLSNYERGEAERALDRFTS